MYWCISSERFKTFVENGQNFKKILKWIKEAPTNEALRDHWFELGMAYLVLQNEDFLRIEYEKYPKTKHGKSKRGPDFTVTHQNGIIFNLEVKRIRKPELPSFL